LVTEFYVYFLGEIAAMREEGGPIPAIQDILLLSKGGDSYIWLCQTFLKFVVGCSVWGRRHLKEPLTSVVTDSDEAFLVLTVENNYYRWLYESTLPPIKASEPKPTLPPALYTNSGSHTGSGSSRRCYGWSKEGYLRFNVLHKLVRADRVDREAFSTELKTALEEDNAHSRHKAPQEESDDDEIIPANDMAGAEQPKQDSESENDYSSDEE
jgi:hypothetical protein